MRQETRPPDPGIADPRAFRRFLEWLDEGTDSGGEKYLEMRRRLVSYFDRKNCLAPDDLADEALSRVARRLAEEGAITDTPPARYCYIVARFVFLEYQRRAKPAEMDLTALPGPPRDDTAEARRKLLDCLEHCMGGLDKDQQDLILEYYRGEGRIKIEHRRLMAAKRGLTLNAMSIRACRIRDRLEVCVRSCSAARSSDLFS
jgi:DNA-directed RNA polymerase specialized sigma24 family protein